MSTVGKVNASWSSSKPSTGEFPPTLTDRSGNGRHLFYACDEPPPSNKLADHIDTRGATGYVIVAPSRHRNGRRYAWENWWTVPAPLPAWVTDELSPKVNREVSADAEPLPDPKPAWLSRFLEDKAGTVKDRSRRTYALVSRCVEERLTDGQVLTATSEHEPSVEKYGDRLEKETLRLLGKIDRSSARPDPFDRPRALAQPHRRRKHPSRGRARMARQDAGRGGHRGSRGHGGQRWPARYHPRRMSGCALSSKVAFLRATPMTGSSASPRCPGGRRVLRRRDGIRGSSAAQRGRQDTVTQPHRRRERRPARVEPNCTVTGSVSVSDWGCWQVSGRHQVASRHAWAVRGGSEGRRTGHAGRGDRAGGTRADEGDRVGAEVRIRPADRGHDPSRPYRSRHPCRTRRARRRPLGVERRQRHDRPENRRAPGPRPGPVVHEVGARRVRPPGLGADLGRVPQPGVAR